MAHAAASLADQGLVLGRYRPLRPLGSGGSGSVWLARDESGGGEVALKIIAREGKAALRAEREAEAAGRLRHERCLRVHDVGHDAGHVYLAYEYVPGRTLREALRAGELDDPGAVEAAAQVLDGLAHAHGRGIVHRDVKPSNILLADGDEISVRLLDFGLARMEEAEGPTAVGDVPGTLAYIPPERLAGRPATPASDVWAVGVLLWEALAGGHPFWKPSLLESAKAIEAGAAPLARLRPDLPRPLLDAVDRALARDPAGRPSAAGLAAALRRIGARRERKPRRERPRSPLPLLAPRALPAALATVTAAWCATILPFYPGGAPFVLAALAGLATLLHPRAGLALTLTVPVFPIGNHSLGFALLYAGLAVLWLIGFWREPRGGLLVAAGPLLAPLAGLVLLPLAVASLRSPVRRALTAGTALLLSLLVAVVRGDRIPFTDETAPAHLPLAGLGRPVEAARALVAALAARPAIAVLALGLAAAAALLPRARTLGPWGSAAWGAAILAVAVPPFPHVSAVPVLVGVWATCLLLARPTRMDTGRVLQGVEARLRSSLARPLRPEASRGSG